MKVIFEDRDIIIVDKPAGQAVHPSPGIADGTLVDELKAHYPAIAGVGSKDRPGIVHRLDRDTSGVMVVAKNQRAYLALRRAFESHDQITKIYLAVCHGRPKSAHGTLNTTIGRKKWDSKRMAADVPDGQPAITHWETLGSRGGLSLMQFSIDTGRTHQIRVHAAYLGVPIVGDPLYGDNKKDGHLQRKPRRMLLHAARLGLRHPVSGEWLEFDAEIPPEIVHAI